MPRWPRRSARHGRWWTNAIRIVHAHEHNLKRLSVDIPRGKFSVITGVSGSGKSTLAFDIPVQRRPAALPGVAERLRAQHRAAGRAAGGGCGVWHPADGGDRAAACRAAGAKSTVGTTTEVAFPLRLLWVKLACSTACTTAPVRPQSAESIAAQLLRDHRGQHVGLAPLVVNRKGVYTDLAKWAKARPHAPARVDGEFRR